MPCFTSSSRLFGTRRRVPAAHAWPLFIKGHDEGRWDRLVECSIIEQNGGRLAAQFEGDALHRRGAVTHDRLANGNRTCERDLSHVGISDELGADDIAEARDNIARRPSVVGLVQRFDHHPGLYRAQLAGLDNDGTTGGDGRGQL